MGDGVRKKQAKRGNVIELSDCFIKRNVPFICTVAFYSTAPDTNQLDLKVLLAVATSSSSCSSSFIMPAVASNNLEGSTRSADGCQ